MALVRSLFDAPTTTFRGAHYQLSDAVAEPKPLQPHLPLLVAGAGSGTMRVAARHADMWNAIGLLAAFAERLSVLHEYLREAGRDRAVLLATASFRLIIREDTGESRERIQQLDPVWREDAYRIVGGTAKVVRELQEYLRAGARGLIVQMPAPFDFATLERLAGEVRGALLLGR